MKVNIHITYIICITCWLVSGSRGRCVSVRHLEIMILILDVYKSKCVLRLN